MFHAEVAAERDVARQTLRSNGDDDLSRACGALLDSVLDGQELLEQALRREMPGEICAVSSFGAESVLLLALIAEIDRTTPILFLETRRHFPETLAFKELVARRLGLSDVRDLVPERTDEHATDPTGELWFYDPDACCALRKVRPLDAGLAPFRGWITGRKRYQAATRSTLPVAEVSLGRLKINPLAGWDPARIERETTRRGLPRHPLVAEGYASIGCANCTRPVRPGDDGRAGRWQGARKTECGIHAPN